MKKAMLLVCCVSVNAHSGGIPTFDAATLVPAAISAVENFNQVQQQIESVQQLRRQLAQQVEQFEAITGSYDMSALLNNDAYREARRFVPAQWDETVDLIEGLYNGGGLNTLSGYVDQSRAEDINYTVDELYRDPDSTYAQQYSKETNATVAQISVGKSHYARSLAHIEDFEALTDEIDSATDLKGAIDLQNRIQAEHGIAVAELIRLQSSMQINASELRANDHNLKAADMAMSSGIIPNIP